MRLVVVDNVCQAHLALSSDRAQKLTDEISEMLGRKAACLAQMQKLVVGINFAQTSVMGGLEG